MLFVFRWKAYFLNCFRKMPTFIPRLESRMQIWKRRRHLQKEADHISISPCWRTLRSWPWLLFRYPDHLTLLLDLVGYWNSAGLRALPCSLVNTDAALTEGCTVGEEDLRNHSFSNSHRDADFYSVYMLPSILGQMHFCFLCKSGFLTLREKWWARPVPKCGPVGTSYYSGWRNVLLSNSALTSSTTAVFSAQRTWFVPYPASEPAEITPVRICIAAAVIMTCFF